MTGVQTDWQPFTRPDVTVPTAMLDGIRGRTADAWVNVEPEPQRGGRGLARRKNVESAYAATVSPYADDDEPHFALYLKFPKGARFTARCPTLPAGVEVDDDSADDAMLRAPMSTPAADTMRFVMDALESCSEGPLGNAWRSAVGDATIVHRHF